MTALALRETVDQRLAGDREHLARYRNDHRGDARCFILGCGRSLADIPVDVRAKLDGEITFGVNYLARWDGLPRSPTYWCVSEWGHLKTVHRLLRDRIVYPRARFVASVDLEGWPGVRMRDPELASWLWIPRDISRPIANGYLGGIDTLDYTATGGGVVFECALQIAAWMGFSRIYLLGVDADHRNHVYDPPGTTDNDGLRAEIRIVAQRARETLHTRAGIELINATPGGKLDSIPRETLESALAQ